MTVKLSRWGNSLAVRIPSWIAADAAWKPGSALAIDYADGTLRLTTVAETPSLEELIGQIHADNLHAGVDFGSATGKEAW